MQVIRSIISLFMLVVIGFCFAGVAWWGAPPEKLAHYTDGGRAILILTAIGCVIGLVSLWRNPDKAHG